MRATADGHQLERLNRPKTRGVVLDLIRAARTISRVELAAGSGLTAPTITQVVRGLIDDGLVVEAGRGESTGGKPRTLLQLNAAARYSVGVQLERYTSVIVIVDLAGRPVARASFPGAGQAAPDETLRLVAEHVDTLLTTAGVARSKVLGVGLVSHGPQDRVGGTLLAPQTAPGWHGYPVVRRLAEFVRLPVLLDNDATAAAVGEFWIGGVDPASTYGCIYLGGGFGGGVVVAGEVYRGSSSNTMEVGHITVAADGAECPCGNRGCLEIVAGPWKVISEAWASPGLAARLGLDRDGADLIADFALIAGAAMTGDPTARALIEKSARYVGYAAVTLTNLFDLDRIVLAGPSFTPAGSIYQSMVQAVLDRATFARAAHRVQVALSASGSDAAAVGGAALVLRGELTPRHLRRPDGGSLGYTYSGHLPADRTTVGNRSA
ncbi:MAG TPA: ROK family transcriptional regulator [Mycobacteriales bacterium]|nr:ROK family transcriptional regulator [Mycobacteriales bacterium]